MARASMTEIMAQIKGILDAHTLREEVLLSDPGRLQPGELQNLDADILITLKEVMANAEATLPRAKRSSEAVLLDQS